MLFCRREGEKRQKLATQRKIVGKKVRWQERNEEETLRYDQNVKEDSKKNAT